MLSEKVEAIAAVYAQALFELADENGSLDRVRDDFDALVRLLDTLPEFAALLASPSIRRSEKKGFVARVLGEVLSPLMNQFLGVLLERNRGSLVGAIHRHFQHRLDEHRGILTVHVTTAVPLDDQSKARVAQAVGQALDKQIRMTCHTDPRIMGGLTLTMGHTVINASIKNRLRQMEQQLNAKLSQLPTIAS